MFGCFIEIFIDTVLLMVLLKTISDQDVDVRTAIWLAIGISVGTGALAVGLVMLMGIAGIFVAAILAGVGLGVAVSALFGIEIKRSFLIAGIFMVVHIGTAVGLNLMFRA